MTAATSRLRRRGIGAGVAALVGLSGLGLAAVPAQAAPGFDPSSSDSRVAGIDRFETAAKAAVAAFPGGADTAILANGYRNIDALSGGFLAGQAGAPILLADTDSVPQFTLDALDDLGVTNVWILGDETSIGAGALEDLAAAGITVTEQLAGDDRYDTAAQVFAEADTAPTSVFIARADYANNGVAADALAAGPLAYNGTPILLTEAGVLPDATAAALEDSGITDITFLGNGISQAVQDEVSDILPDADTEVVGGADRSGTAALLAEWGIANGDYETDAAAIANGDKPDALAAGPWAAITKTPILLTLGTGSLGEGTTNFLEKYKASLTEAYVFGDANSINAVQTDAAEEAADGGPAPTTNQTLAVTPAESVQLGLDEVRQYSVAGLDAASKYRVTLVNSDNVSVGADGTVTFEEDGTSGLALPGGVDTDITVVNGVSAATPGQSIGGISPTNGTVSFTVTTDAAKVESFVPVVYVDGGANTRLELDDDGKPTEAFGLGGAVQTVPDEAGTGAISPATQDIVVVDKVGDSIITANALFNYDAGDNYFIGGTAPVNAVTPEEFEAQLSVGDDLVAGTVYQQNPALTSTFVLADTNPAPLAALALVASETTDTSITVTLPALDGDATEVKIYAEADPVETPSATDSVVTDESDVVATVSPEDDADADLAGTQVVISGLTANTIYDFNASQTVDGEESALVAANELNDVATRATAVDRATIVNAVLSTDAPLEGTVGDGDVWTLEFSEAVVFSATTTLDLADNNGDTFRVINAASTAGDFLTGATFAYLNADGTVNSTATEGTIVRVTLDENAEDRNAAGDVTATSGSIGYPATITSVANLVDDDDSVAPNIAGSADVVIDSES